MKNLEFSPCHVDELPILRQLAESTFVTAFGAQNKPEDMAAYVAKAFSLTQVQAEFNHPDSHFYFAKDKGIPVAYLKINFRDAQTEWQEPDGMEIERIYVRADYQGQGIGAQFFDFAWKIAVERGMKYIWLGVWNQNAGAIRFYQCRGFQAFSQHSFLLGQDLQTDILMRKEVV